MGSLTQYKWFSSRIENCRAPQHTRLTSSVSCLLLGNISSETGKSCVSTSNQKIQQLTTSTLDLSSTRSSIGVHSNPPEIWRTLPWRIETRNRKTKMKNTIFFFYKLLFVPITNNFLLCSKLRRPWEGVAKKWQMMTGDHNTPQKWWCHLWTAP